MADDAVVRADQAETVVLTIKAGTTVLPGSLLGYNAGWVLADADGRFRAEFVAMDYAKPPSSGTEYPNYAANCHAVRRGTIFDRDAPYTAGDVQYLSTTAGAHTATQPAISTTLTIQQRIGVAISTTEVAFDLQPGPTYLRATAAVDPASGTTDTAQNLAVTVTGVLATDGVTLMSVALAQGVVFNGSIVPAADSVTIGIANASAGTVDGASAVCTFLVTRF